MFSASCAICISLLDKSDDILTTVCGHVFHMPCLTQWLERSKNCPSCRQKLSSSRIFRLYMTFNNDESFREDPASLNERIMNMQFQIDLKNTEIQNTIKTYQDIAKQRDLLKQEVKRCESELAKKTSAIYGLKEQVKYFQEMSRGRDGVEAQYNALKKKIETYDGVERLLKATSDEVEEMLRGNQDPRQLCTYVAALQKQLTVDCEKRRQIRNIARSAEDRCRKLEAEKKELENELKSKADLEMYAESLEKEVQELKNRLFNKNSKDDGAREIVHSSSSPDLSKRPAPKKIAAPSDLMLFSDEEENVIMNKRYKITTAQSGLRSKDLPGSSVLKKRPRLAYNASSQPQKTDERLVPDGLGGYTKIERFPVASKSSPVKKSMKRKAEDIPKISGFVDLT